MCAFVRIFESQVVTDTSRDEVSFRPLPTLKICLHNSGVHRPKEHGEMESAYRSGPSDLSFS